MIETEALARTPGIETRVTPRRALSRRLSAAFCRAGRVTIADLPDSQRALLLITGAGVAFVVAAFCAQHGISLPAMALPAVAGTMGLGFMQFRPGELAAERKARGQCPSCGYEPRCNVSGMCPERGGQT